jgi:hypothetical protein
MAHLYTVIAEYRGGTYIKQLRARSAKDAVQKWLKQSDTSIPKNLSAALRRISAETLEPVLIDGCENVWCASSSYKGLLLLNIVKTVSS